MQTNRFFTAQVPIHWCSVPILTAANWTDEQVRNISSADSCTVYDYDYQNFARIGFDEALEYKRNHGPQKSLPCETRSFARNHGRTSLVEDVSVTLLPFTFLRLRFTNRLYGKLFLEPLANVDVTRKVQNTDIRDVNSVRYRFRFNIEIIELSTYRSIL